MRFYNSLNHTLGKILDRTRCSKVFILVGIAVKPVTENNKEHKDRVLTSNK